MTIGPVTAIRLDPPALDVGGDAFLVAAPGLLGGLTVGDHVAVTWEEEGLARRAVLIAPRWLPGSLRLDKPPPSRSRARAKKQIHTVRVYQTRCAACGQRLANACGVLFQGDQLVHAACWRDGAEPERVLAPGQVTDSEMEALDALDDLMDTIPEDEEARDT